MGVNSTASPRTEIVWSKGISFGYPRACSQIRCVSRQRKPRRFYGSIEIDVDRHPVKSFEDILNSVIMELQRTPGTKVKLILEIEANAEGGFDETEVGIVRDNARQLKFNAGSTGFEE
jgi:hypothetical protein